MPRSMWLFLALAALALGACGSRTEPEVAIAADTAPVADAPAEDATPVETPVPRDLPSEPAEGTDAEFAVEADPATVTYPAGDEPSLEAMLNPLVEEFGVRFTRGSLVDRRPGIYEPSPTGNHLALYVAPIEDITGEQYVTNIWEIAAVVTPYVFANFSGVSSYDICQEPYSQAPRVGIPPPITQIDIDRTASDNMDWSDGSLSDLIVALRSEEGELTMRVDPELQQVPAFVAALADAGL